MITQMSNGWYMFDEHEVPRIIDALLVAGYNRLPHWFFVYGHHHVTIQYSRRKTSILAPPDVWDAYADLFDLDDPEVIAGRLDRLGWRRRPSYGFTGPGAAVTIMSSAVTGSEMWLDIRGPKPHLVRAVLGPLGVAQLADDVGQETRTSQPTVPDVTAHPLVQAEVYLPSAYTGVIVAARDAPRGTTLCHVRHADGMIEQYRRTDLELVTDADAKTCHCGQPMIYQGFASRTISKAAVNLPITWPQPDEREQPMRVLVLSAAKVWQCPCGAQVEQPVARGYTYGKHH